MLLRKLFLLLTLSLACFTAYGQLEVDEDEYENEFTLGLNANSNSGLIGGFNFTYSRKRSPKTWHYYSLEVVNVRHEKEIKLSTINSSSFFPGKTNYLFSIRPSYGRVINLFKKYPEDGVRLNFNYAGGPTIGLLKPYFIEYNFLESGNNIVRDVAYDPTEHTIDRIQGDSGLLFNLNESRFKLGAHLRTALNFEYGPFPDMMIGVEAGSTFEVFASEIILNQNMNNRQFYPAFFFHLYYGYRF